MTERGIADRRADALYAWLLAQEAVLPPDPAIGRAMPEFGDGVQVSDAFRLLARQGRIEQRHGSLRWMHGHRIVRIVATGAVLQTAGCMLRLGETVAGAAGRKHRIAEDTLRRVLGVVEACADRHLYLPRPAGLGRRTGLSAETARRALAALHDDGRLILRQRGMRRAAELPDGRRTL